MIIVMAGSVDWTKRQGSAIQQWAYFIETGVGSLVNTMANGQAAEVGTIGNEGLVGLPLVFGDDRAPTSVYVQVPGAGRLASE